MGTLTKNILERMALNGRLWLFLDYDGTLADFAPNPDTLIVDDQLIALLGRLSAFPEILRVVIMSGRRYSHIEKLLPVPGILLAGNYGIEYKTWEGELVSLLDFEKDRPFLDQVKTEWQNLIRDQEGFYLEDKGYSVALHGKRAEDKACREILAEARKIAAGIVERGAFRMLGGNRFLEVAPTIANKGQSVSTLLKRFPWPNADMLYLGDDDKDEEAFKVIQALGGTAVVVAKEPRSTLADERMVSPNEVRTWLAMLAEVLEKRANQEPLHSVK